MSDSVRPHKQQPTRLCCPWDSPGKNSGVGCHFLLQCMKVKSESQVAQSCPTLSDPMDCSPPGSSIRGIFQARVLEWGAIAFSYLYIESTKYCDGKEQGSKAACMVSTKPGGRDPERHPWRSDIDTELWWMKHRWEVNEVRSETTWQDMLKSLDFKLMGSLLKDFQHHTSAMSDLLFSNITLTPVYSKGWDGERRKTKELT